SKSVPQRWVVGLGVLRVVAVGLFVLCLMRPVWSYTASTDDRPSLLVMADTSHTMRGGGDDGARLSAVLESMRESGLRDELEGAFEVPWFAFDQDARPMTPEELIESELAGTSKRLGRSLETAWHYHRLNEPRAADGGAGRDRVLLISDGNDLGEDTVAAAQRLGLAIYPVVPPDVTVEDAQPRVTVANFQGAQSVLLGSEARFRGRLRVEGAVEGEIQLVLSVDGEPTVQRELTLSGDAPERYVELTHRPASPGRKSYKLQVAATENGPRFETGRAASVNVNVMPRQHQVLLLEDSWRWSFRFLRRVFESDPSFSFTAFVARRPGTYIQAAEPDRQVRLDSFPRGRGELEWFDTIILGDVDPRYWPEGLAPALQEMVVERGKSLVVIAGPGLPRLAQVPALERLLPVEPYEGGGYREGPIEIARAVGAEDAALFYTPGGRDFFEVFDDLPPMDQIYAPLRKRPAANLLMEAPEHANDYGNLIVMAEHTVGRGRVLYIGTDSLWKWQTLASRDAQRRTPYTVFWQQALRALAPRRSSEGIANLWLQTDRSRYATSEPVRLEAELEMRGDRPAPANVEVNVELPDERELPVALQRDPGEPGVYHTRFQPPVAGTYTIRGRAERDGETLAEASTRIEVETPEALGPRPNNVAALERIASATGGRVVSMDDPDTWPRVAADERRVVSEARTVDLWRDWFLLLALAGVLGVDWLVRLLRGFV
ncbi:MAG: hypothetical protein ACODAQ_05740, partial [Phycisphaeraceae bacterium]